MATTTKSTTTQSFLFTDDAIAALARDYVAGVNRSDSVRGTYLRVLVAHAQHELKVQRVTIPATLAAINRANDRLYAIVLAAITTPELVADDTLSPEESSRRALARNRRTNFARSAKATLVRFSEEGGKLRTLDPATVTKDQLRKAGPDGQPARPLVMRMKRTEARLERMVKELAAEDMDRAQEFITGLYQKLTDIVHLPQIAPTRIRDESMRPTVAQVAAH